MLYLVIKNSVMYQLSQFMNALFNKEDVEKSKQMKEANRLREMAMKQAYDV